MHSAHARFVMSRPACGPSCEERGDACAFQVAWSINPHMRIGSVDAEAACDEHRRLETELRRAGAEVQLVPFVHGAFDSVFAKDNAILVERPSGVVDALVARPRHPERAREQRRRRASLGELGICVEGAATAPLEGGDVVVLPGASGAFLGHGFRSSPRAANCLERFLQRDVVTLELRDPRLYHLDMALAVLDDGSAIVCEEALVPSSVRLVEEHPAVARVLRVPLEEALRFGANLVQVGRVIMTAATAPSTRRALRSLGYDVRSVALDQFHHAGGSAACLVSRVHGQRPSIAEAQPTAA